MGILHVLLKTDVFLQEYNSSLQKLKLSYRNTRVCKKNTAFKFRNSLREFKVEPPIDGQLGHQWEIGFKNYPLKKLKDAVKKTGWDIINCDFTSGTRSIFLVVQNKSIIK